MDGFIGFILGVFLGGIVGIMTINEVNEAWKVEAAERGYAKWSIDAKGEKSWQWIENSAKESK